MIRLLLLLLLAFSTMAHAALAVTGTTATSVARGALAPVAKLLVTDHDVTKTVSIRFTVVDDGVNSPTFGDANGFIKRIRLYNGTFDPLNTENNRLGEQTFTGDALQGTVTFTESDDTSFTIIVVMEIDENNEGGGAAGPVRINDLQIRYTENAVDIDVLPVAADIKIAYFELLIPDGTSTLTACAANGSHGSGVIANNFSLNNFTADVPVTVTDQSDTLPVMVFEIKAVGSDFSLKSVQFDNEYVGQEVEERFQVSAEVDGLTNAELINLNTPDPCGVVGTVRNFANSANHRLLGTLSGIDTDLTNNFTSATRGLFTGDHVKNAGTSVVIGENDSEYFMISYKLCSTCSFMDLNGDNRFIVASRIDDEFLVLKHTSSIDNIVVDVKNTTTTAPNAAATKSFQEFVGLNFDSSSDTYKGLVSPLNTFSPGSRAEVFQMRFLAQGTDLTFDSLILNTNSGDFTQVDRIDIYTDELMTQLVGSVTTFPSVSRVTVPLHAVNDSATPGLLLNTFSGTNPATDLFVAATFKVDADLGDYDLSLFSGSATVGTTVVDVIGALNTSPNVGRAQETATVTITNTSVRVTSMNLSIRPAKAIEGMVYVPVLWFELNSNTQLNNQTFTISNTNDAFNAQNRGVRRVSIFKDCDTVEDCESFDSELNLGEDVLLGSAVPTASATNSAEEISISGITIQSGRTQYIVAYDIGHDINPAVNLADAQFNGVTGQSVAGVLPGPSGGTDMQIIQNLFTIEEVSAADSVGAALSNVGDGETESFNFAIEVLNGFAQPVNVINVRPVAYQNSLSGLDISHQFTISADAANPAVNDTAYSETNPTAVVNGDDRRFNYDVAIAELTHTGQTLMDAFVSFVIPEASRVGDLTGVGDSFVSMFRYNSDTTKSAAGLTAGQLSGSDQIVQFTSVGSAIDGLSTDHEFPSFVESVEVVRGGTDVIFSNFHPLSSGESLKINFVNPEQVDFVSAEITLNPGEEEQILPSSANLSSSTDAFFSIVGAGTSSGRIEIHNLQRSSNGLNTLQIQLSDISGNALDTLTISFFMSETILIDHFYIFPNPYNPNVQPEMEFGFSVTHQPDTVKIFIVSSTGRLISELNFTAAEHPELTTNGYKRLTWDPRTRTNITSSLAPGIYIAKLVVTDSAGRTVSKVTKFAVY